MKDNTILSKKKIKAFMNILSLRRLNISILNDDEVVKLPNKPMYKKIYLVPLTLFKNNPANAEPLIFTKIVVTGSPAIE